MALQLDTPTPQNYTASYWRIFSVTNANINNGTTDIPQCSITLELWKDAATRQAVEAGTSEFQPVQYQTLSGPIQTSIQGTYDYLKTLPQFAGAVSC